MSISVIESTKKGGIFYICYLADSWPSMFKKIPRRKIERCNISYLSMKTLEILKQKDKPMNFRFCAKLTMGLIHIYLYQMDCLLRDIFYFERNVHLKVRKFYEAKPPKTLKRQKEPDTEEANVEHVINQNIVARLEDITIREEELLPFQLPCDGFGSDDERNVRRMENDKSLQIENDSGIANVLLNIDNFDIPQPQSIRPPLKKRAIDYQDLTSSMVLEEIPPENLSVLKSKMRKNRKWADLHTELRFHIPNKTVIFQRSKPISYQDIYRADMLLQNLSFIKPSFNNISVIATDLETFHKKIMTIPKNHIWRKITDFTENVGEANIIQNDALVHETQVYPVVENIEDIRATEDTSAQPSFQILNLTNVDQTLLPHSMTMKDIREENQSLTSNAAELCEASFLERTQVSLGDRSFPELIEKNKKLEAWDPKSLLKKIIIAKKNRIKNLNIEKLFEMNDDGTIGQRFAMVRAFASLLKLKKYLFITVEKVSGSIYIQDIKLGPREISEIDNFSF